MWDFANLNKYNVDNRLIVALCERWRPETHTFLFPSGECTITLEDVHMLLGLKVNGEPITGKTEVGWEIVEPILGSKPLNSRHDGKSIRLSWLQEYINGVGMTGPPTTLHMFRAYVLYLIGSRIMPNNSGNLVHLSFLQLLDKSPEEVGQYSWGSACLATLYRSLCDGAIYGNTEMPGCTILLQAWAWSRMSCLAPVPRIPPQAHTQLPLANM